MHAILNGEGTIDNYASKNCYPLVEVINCSSLFIEAGSNEHGYVNYYAIEVHSGESGEHISEYTFKNCTSITQATIKGGFLGQYAFLGYKADRSFLRKGRYKGKVFGISQKRRTYNLLRSPLLAREMGRELE